MKKVGRRKRPLHCHPGVKTCFGQDQGWMTAQWEHNEEQARHFASVANAFGPRVLVYRGSSGCVREDCFTSLWSGSLITLLFDMVVLFVFQTT